VNREDARTLAGLGARATGQKASPRLGTTCRPVLCPDAVEVTAGAGDSADLPEQAQGIPVDPFFNFFNELARVEKGQSRLLRVSEVGCSAAPLAAIRPMQSGCCRCRLRVRVMRNLTGGTFRPA
jgi:hypothetical protein